jgi:hydroxymethylpyrimidine/phosphomethylpyrimidine kinase
MNGAKMPVCMTMAGLDPSGGAGVIADIRTFAAFGCFGTAAISSLTFQNTVGVFGAEYQSAECVRQQAQPVIDDLGVDALKTGMLPTIEIIEEAARLIGSNGLRNIVVDPVVRSTSGFDLIDDAALESLIRNLFPIADLVTPNIPEAERITRSTIKSVVDIEKAASAMHLMGARNVLIKGGHAARINEAGIELVRDYLYIGSECHPIDAVYVETTATHGTGCTLAAAITANLALGNGLIESVEIAKRYVNAAIRTPTSLGRGNSPIGSPKWTGGVK